MGQFWHQCLLWMVVFFFLAFLLFWAIVKWDSQKHMHTRPLTSTCSHTQEKEATLRMCWFSVWLIRWKCADKHETVLKENIYHWNPETLQCFNMTAEKGSKLESDCSNWLDLWVTVSSFILIACSVSFEFDSALRGIITIKVFKGGRWYNNNKKR